MNMIRLIIIAVATIGVSGSFCSSQAFCKNTASRDWRDIRNGRPIPDEGYCDQPYVVITRDGNWLCT